MTTSHNDTSKCFSAFLRCVLCSGSLPTHPSDLITEPNNFSLFDHPLKHSKIEVTKSQPPQTPGIVARLMGLDSLPDLNWAPKQRTLESILRSRSVNSANYLPKFDLTRSNHRRVQTSVSFREIPTSLQQKNDDFVVPCIENVGLGNKSEMGLGETERNRGNLGEKKFEKREKQDNNRVCRREESDDLFVVCVENVGGSNKSEMGLGELQEKKVKTERNRGNLRGRKFGRREEEGNRALLQQKNDDLFVLCFEKVGGSNKMRLSGSKCEMGFEESRETEINRGSFREKKFDERENQGNNSSEVKVVDRKSREKLKEKGVVKALNYKETCVESEFGNKKKSGSRNRAKKVETLCNLETPSHVSVVDPSGDSRSRATIPNSDNNSSKLSRSNANFDNNSSISTRIFVPDDTSLLIRAKRNRDCKPKNTKEEYCEVVCEIFRLTEKETRESNWMGETGICFEDVEEICTQFGQQMLDSMVHQVVDEFVGCDMNLI